jgi:2-hydroxy-3-keto-5-methylthiopentenyl-1-phosphate phosphatase
METTITKLQKLNQSVQKLETVLQEVWSVIDELGEDAEFKQLMNKANSKKSDQNGLSELLSEFDNSMEQIPEDGTAAVDFEDAISELIEWMQQNK